MVPGVCWEVMEGRGGVVRRWWSGEEKGEVVLQGLAGNGVNRAMFEVGGKETGSMVPGVCWEVMEGRGGVVRRWWSGEEKGEVVLQGLAGNGVNKAMFEVGGKETGYCFRDLHN
uniref:Uncharacterized protein n=1 Tax=Tanacetum cinerariifolium TaxID=118510 RepID=A0A699GI51_TANCI|nr:hypothetical protein [Tanacetum cinerariifolium]